MKIDSKIKPFSTDADQNRGYLYTTNAGLGSYLANRRLTDIALEMVAFADKRVLDVGSGDGTYTLDLFNKGHPTSIQGIDLSEGAIKIAKHKYGGRAVSFDVQSADTLNFSDNSFDIAHLRGVLHHMDNPKQAIGEALRVAPTVLVLEPNGYNPILKLLERFSRYHIEHQEKSYFPAQLRQWVRELGAEINSGAYVGLVPNFCPAVFARTLKFIEPILERIPIANKVACGVYVFVAQRPLRS